MTDLVTRKILRKRTATALAAAGVAGGNVSPSRVQPLKPGSFPYGLVYTPRESGSNPSNDGPPKFATIIDLVMDFLLSDDTEDALDDAMDDLLDAALAATIENADWLAGIESVTSLEITKHPPGPDGMPVMTGARIQLQVSVGLVAYEPTIPDAFTGIDGIAGGATEFGIDINGDGKADLDVQIDVDQ